jgi:hypothetical protein
MIRSISSTRMSCDWKHEVEDLRKRLGNGELFKRGEERFEQTNMNTSEIEVSTSAFYSMSSQKP